MAIDSVLNPVGMAKKLSVPQLQKAIQDGLIPPYVGIPVLQEKVQLEQRMRNAAVQAQQGPTVAQQVMADAQGLNQLQSNLPAQMAGGGIVAFALGGDLDEDMIDDEEDDDITKDISRAMAEMDALRERSAALDDIAARQVEKFPRSITFPGLTSTEVKKGVSIKEGSEPARTVEQTEKSISKPVGLEQLLSKVEQIESGGRRYGKDGQLLTSPKGALGEMQVMPATARDPGFGIRPAEVNDPNELRRVGREYYGKLLERYGDPKLAAIAYNMGPGATDKWLMAGADPLRLPDETRKYAQNFSEGGITSIKRFQYGGISGTMPYSLSSVGMDDLARMARMGEPGAAEELMRRRATAPAGNLLNQIAGQSPEEMRAAAERRLRMEQARGAFSAAPSASAAPVAPTSPAVAQEGLFSRGVSALRQAPYEIGKFFGQAVKSPFTRGVGLGALLTPRETNVGEMEELERRRQMPPTITTTEKLTPMAPLPTATKPSSVQAPTGAGAGRGGQGGPSAEEMRRVAFENAVGRTQDTEDMEAGIYALEPESKPEIKQTTPAEPSYMDKLRERIERGYGKLEKQAESDKYLGLLAAGLGMMSGTSPFAAANIGRGGIMGVQALQEAERTRAAQEAKLMNAALYSERFGQLGEMQKAQLAAKEQMFRESEERKRAQAEAAESGKAEAKKLRAAEIARKMETDYLNRAETTARNALKSNPVLSMDETKSAAFIDQARAEARAKLNMNPAYRNLMKQAYEGYDPGEIDVSSEINDLLGKYLKPKK
ncbi:hypothetical protein EBT31_03365 [bacterium]|nr:hypothetical protein [bacterium]